MSEDETIEEPEPLRGYCGSCDDGEPEFVIMGLGICPACAAERAKYD